MIDKIKNNKNIIALIIVSCLAVISGSLLAPVEALFVNSLTDNKVLLGLTFSVGTFFIFIFSVYLGRKSVHWGRKRLVLAGFVVGIFFPLIYATALNVFQYMLGKGVWAFACVSGGAMLNSIFQDFISEKKNISELIGWKLSAQSISGTIGAILGGLIADVFGFRAPYYFVMAVYFIALIIFFIFVYDDVPELKVSNKEKRQSIKTSLQDILSHPKLFLRVFLEGFTQAHWVMQPIIFPLIIFEITGKNVYTGLVFGLMGAIAMIIFPFIGKFVDKYLSIKSLKIAFSFYISGLLILSFSKTLFIFIIGALILSIGKAFNGIASSRIETKNIKSEYRGEYLSYIKAYDTLTASLAAIFVGCLLKYFDPYSVLFISAIITTIGVVLGFFIYNLQDKKHVQH